MKKEKKKIESQSQEGNNKKVDDLTAYFQ